MTSAKDSSRRAMKSFIVNLQKWTLILQNASIQTIPKGCFEDLKFFTLLAYHGPGIWQIKGKVAEIIMRLRLV